MPKVAPAFKPVKGKTKKQNDEARKAHNSRMRRAVYEGKYEKTRGGLKKKDLAVSKSGKIVSKRKMELGKKAFKKNKKSMAKPFGKK